LGKQLDDPGKQLEDLFKQPSARQVFLSKLLPPGSIASVRCKDAKCCFTGATVDVLVQDHAGFGGEASIWQVAFRAYRGIGGSAEGVAGEKAAQTGAGAIPGISMKTEAAASSSSSSDKGCTSVAVFPDKLALKVFLPFDALTADQRSKWEPMRIRSDVLKAVCQSTMYCQSVRWCSRSQIVMDGVRCSCQEVGRCCRVCCWNLQIWVVWSSCCVSTACPRAC
jgi:hypothetical protein